VRFDSRDPELAARVVNTLASDYVDQSLEARWQATQRAAEWLSQQLVGVKAKLEKSEDELQGYARRNGLVFLETDKGASQNVANGVSAPPIVSPTITRPRCAVRTWSIRPWTAS